MSVITIIVTLAIVGFVTWLITSVIPMPAVFRTAIIGIMGLFVVLWLLGTLGFHTGINFRLR